MQTPSIVARGVLGQDRPPMPLVDDDQALETTRGAALSTNARQAEEDRQSRAKVHGQEAREGCSQEAAEGRVEE
jgi:hypothetical protein